MISKTFVSNGVRIAYLDEGMGHPILLIHGLFLNLEANWVNNGWFKTLKRAGYRVIAYDCRGHGQSQKLYGPNDYSMQILSDDARRLLDHLKVRQSHLFGWCMGSRIAAFLAAENMGRIGRVIFGGMGINMLRRQHMDMPLLHGVIADALEVDCADQVLNSTARKFRLFAESNGCDLKAMATYSRAVKELITPELLSKISGPAYVICGSEDELCGSPSELAALLPIASSKIIPSVSHLEALEHPLFRKAVLDFLTDQA